MESFREFKTIHSKFQDHSFIFKAMKCGQDHSKIGTVKMQEKLKILQSLGCQPFGVVKLVATFSGSLGIPNSNRPV